jgi:hypothetical protein
MYDWSELTKLWEVERVTTEQAIGQLIKHGEAHHRILVDLQRRLDRLEQGVALLTARQPPPEAGRTNRSSL